MRSFSTFDVIVISFGILYSFSLRYKRGEDAKMALEQMDGFELAGRTVMSLSGLLILLLTFVVPLLAACQYRPREGSHKIHHSGFAG